MIAKFSVQTCTKQKSHTHCARSVPITPPLPILQSATNVVPLEKRVINFHKKKYGTRLLMKWLCDCCQATVCSCDRNRVNDPLIVWSTFVAILMPIKWENCIATWSYYLILLFYETRDSCCRYRLKKMKILIPGPLKWYGHATTELPTLSNTQHTPCSCCSSGPVACRIKPKNGRCDWLREKP